jgi:hypothetical protein
MYGYLFNRFGPVPATIVTAFVYAIMLIAILYAALEPQSELKYLSL